MHAAIDLLESLMLAHGPVPEPEPVHRFTPGLYARELTMEPATLLTSRVHKTEHQYIVTEGRARVYEEATGWREIVAPYHGITKAGTRRVLHILERMVWTTFHPTTETNIEKLEADLWDIRPIRVLGPAERHAVLAWAARSGLPVERLTQ